MARMRELFFPPRCGACGRLLSISPARKTPALCGDCQKKFQQEQLAQCSRCFLPVSDCRCVTSLMEKRGISAHVKLCFFQEEGDGTARRVVLSLKESADKRYYRALAKELAPAVHAAVSASERARAAKGECALKTVIAYLPRTRRQKRIWGVDQAACLSRALGAELGFAVLPLFRRTGKGVQQKSLSRAARMKNATASIRLTKRAKSFSLKRYRVLLVDDVVTTGASMAAAAALLSVGERLAVSVATTPRKAGA